METVYLAIPKDLAQTTANYLATQPYQNVWQILEGLKALKQIEIKEKETEDGPKIS